MKIDTKLLESNLKTYYLTKLQKQNIINYILQDESLLAENDIDKCVHLAANKLNIKLSHKYRNVSKVELILNRISIYVMVILIICGIVNTFVNLVDPLIIILISIVNLIIFNLVDRSYYISAMLTFILIVLFVPLILDFNSKTVVILYAIAVISTFMYSIFIYNRKRVNIDNQNHLYSYSEYDNVNNYFSQKLGEKYINLKRLYKQNQNLGTELYFNNSWGKMSIDLREQPKTDLNIHIVNQYGQIDIIIDEVTNYKINIKSKVGDCFYRPKNRTGEQRIFINGVNNFGAIFFISE